ncbi:FG-GAP repeat domain-containing protein [Nonomuraea recticatena]|uniref:VCBS repeat-containing protein n=1 Tax=Nonomuraea recticatena TaxID=46178 RepID=A0ABN3RKY1_9ACTN
MDRFAAAAASFSAAIIDYWHGQAKFVDVWNGEGGNRFGPATTIGGRWAVFSRPIAGDFNGDGIGDLAAVNKAGNELHVWNGRGSNNFTPAIKLGPGWEPYASTLMSLGDVNEDGHTDIGAVHAETGMLYLWNGKGATSSARPPPSAPAGHPTSEGLQDEDHTAIPSATGGP